MKISLPDPSNLTDALALTRETNDKAAALAAEHTTLAAEVAAFMDADNSDEATLLKVALLKVRLDKITVTIERLTKQRPEHTRILIGEIESFERQLAAAGADERSALLDTIEALLKPFAPAFTEFNGTVRNVARGIAGQVPILARIPASWSELNAPALATQSSSPQALESAQARADALLSIHAAAEANGSFLPAGTLTATR